MKTPTNNLFQLVNSMTAAEKRYFKRHFSSEKSLLTTLFDFINGMEKYDEEEVKQHFSKSTLSKNLKVYKVQLFDLLLKSLTSYHSKRSVNSKIRIGLEEIEILIDKHIYGPAQNRLKKIKELCLQHEDYTKLFQILEFENQFKVFYSVNPLSHAQELFEELETSISHTEQASKLQKLLIELNSRKNEKGHKLLSGKEKVKYNQLLGKLKKQYDIPTLTLKEKSYWYQIVSCIYDLLDKKGEAYQYKKECLSFFETQPSMIESHSRLYFSALHNFLSCCNSLEKYADLEEGIEKIKTLAKKYPYLHRNLTFVYYLETRYYFRQAKFSFIVDKLEKDILDHIADYNLEAEYISNSLFLHFTVTNLVLGKARKVQYFLRQLHSNPGKMPPAFIQTCTILEFISHYETNDYFIIQNLLLSFKRKIKKDRNFSSFFKFLLSFFADLSKSDRETHKQLALAFREEMEAFHEDGVYNLLDGLHLHNWLNALIEQQPFSEWMKPRITE